MTFALGLVGCGGMGRRHVLGMKKLQAAGRMAFDLKAEIALLEQDRRAVTAQHRVAQPGLEPVPAGG